MTELGIEEEEEEEEEGGGGREDEQSHEHVLKSSCVRTAPDLACLILALSRSQNSMKFPTKGKLIFGTGKMVWMGK
jgi:hypothetical protein